MPDYKPLLVVSARWKIMPALFFGFQSAFVVGYIVFTDIPFDGIVDLLFVIDVSSQLMVFWILFLPIVFLLVRFSTLEGDIPLSVACIRLINEPGILLPLALATITYYFVGNGIRESIGILLVALSAAVILFSPPPSMRPASKKFIRSVRIFRSSPKFFWKWILLPRLGIYVRGLASTFLIVFFVWLGAARFHHNVNVSQFEVVGAHSTIQGSIVGRNSSGLVIRIGEQYRILPISSVLELIVVSETPEPS